MNSIDLDKDIIREMYEEKKMSMPQIAEVFNVSNVTIFRRMKEYNIKTRRHPEKRFNRFNVSKNELYYLYHVKKLSMMEISKSLNVNDATVRYWMCQYGIKRRNMKETAKLREKKVNRKGKNGSGWKGGKTIDSRGYVVLSNEGNPIYEHRYVMEQYLNRKLKTKECIHHLNGIRNDNRIENLAIVTNKNHPRRTLIKALQSRIKILEDKLNETKRF